MTDNIARLPAIPRDNSGRFAKGGPGRLVGAKGKRTREALETIKSFGPEAMQQLWKQVQAGEQWAVLFVLNKILPTSRTIEFEGLDADDIRTGIQDGEISPLEGRQLTETLVKLAEISDIAEMKAKIEELSRLINEKG